MSYNEMNLLFVLHSKFVCFCPGSCSTFFCILWLGRVAERKGMIISHLTADQLEHLIIWLDLTRLISGLSFIANKTQSSIPTGCIMFSLNLSDSNIQIMSIKYITSNNTISISNCKKFSLFHAYRYSVDYIIVLVL